MRQWLKYTVDYGPILAFFIAYKLSGLMAATLTLMIATAIATLLLYVVQRRLALMPIITLLVVGTFGGLTLWLHDDTFIKMKPTVIQGLFAAILFGGLIMKKPLIRYVMGSTLQMDDDGWRLLSLRFACFFAAMAVLNEIVWRTQPEGIWIDFKVFGIIGLTFLFILTQIPLIMRHSIEQH
ncbi:MAG TPA: septation protein A [Terriglobales bacterium]|nr:septation protein A [Terriglobales bacterium]